MIKHRSKLILFLTIIWLMPTSVFAMTMSFEPPSLESQQPAAFSTTLVLNTEGQSVNAVDGTLLIAEELGSDITVSDSGSIVTYWVMRPTYDPATRSVKFSGTIPGGFSGQAGILFSVIMPPHQGSAVENAVVVAEANSYLNDGLGTQAKVSTKQFALSNLETEPVDPQIAGQLYVDPNKPDNVPPESFSPQLAQDERVFGGAWFINFATTDKQSGISHYEVQETRSGRLDAGNWQRAESPYQLQDQELHSYIYVVAVDRQGNERMIKVSPRAPQTWWQQYNRDLAIGVGILVLITAGVIYTRRRNRKPSSMSS
jgi:hypothetical protein